MWSSIPTRSPCCLGGQTTLSDRSSQFDDREWSSNCSMRSRFHSLEASLKHPEFINCYRPNTVSPTQKAERALNTARCGSEQQATQWRSSSSTSSTMCGFSKLAAGCRVVAAQPAVQPAGPTKCPASCPVSGSTLQRAAITLCNHAHSHDEVAECMKTCKYQLSDCCAVRRPISERDRIPISCHGWRPPPHVLSF